MPRPEPGHEIDAPTVREGVAQSKRLPAMLRPGVQLAGRYSVLGVLGHGGWGVVYRARDLTLELEVALKVLHPRIAEDPAKLAFFRNEVRVARKVTHPNVCRLHDLVDGPDGCFITMELIAGESLSARLQRERPPLPEALRVLCDVARGLAAAHAAGVIHRDLKPSNVLVAGDRAVVVDFGIADEHHALGSGPQRIVGTRGYMAPEQAAGEPVDVRVDVYALGVLAFVLATGVRPPLVMTQTLAAFDDPPVPPAVEVAPRLAGLPRELAALIAECLAVEPNDRPHDAGEVLRRLTQIAEAVAAGQAGEAAGGEPVAVRTTPFVRRKRSRAVLVGGVLAVAMVAAGVVAVVVTRDSRTQVPAVSAVAAPVAPRIVLPAVDASALPDVDRWLGPVVQRLIADELADAWGLDVELGDSPHPLPGTLVLASRLARDPSGRLRLGFEGDLREAATTRELAVAVAARVVAAHVPEPVRHPTAAELAAVGAHDAEAWRLWRRAEHETLLLRWERAADLCKQALARDPEFSVASLELALTHDTRDAASAVELAHAVELMDRVPVGPLWHLAVTGARQLRSGDNLGAALTAAKVLALDLTPRERLWIELRWASARYVVGAPPAEITPVLVRLAEAHPDHAGAFKLLADMYLSSDSPTAVTFALRYARRATELAPEDGSSRALLAIALLLAGQTDEARRQAAVLARFEPEEKRFTLGWLFELHMALGDPAEAELDTQRLLGGSPQQRADGMVNSALLDLYWGRFERGVRGLLASADALDAAGATVSAAHDRYIAGRQAWLLGDTATALAAFERVAAGTTPTAGNARVLALIISGLLDEARARAAEIPAGSVERASAELAIAGAAHDTAGVLAAFTQIEKLSTTAEHLFAAADALERSGRLDEAAAMFERLSNPIFARGEPIASTRAWYRLGRLRERAEDTAGARAAFSELVRRWGNATARSPEVDDARFRLRTLPPAKAP